MRKCQVTYREWIKEEKKQGEEKTEEGLFHTWGQDGDTENGLSTVGIIEMPDGRVIEAYPSQIKFLPYQREYDYLEPLLIGVKDTFELMAEGFKENFSLADPLRRILTNQIALMSALEAIYKKLNKE